MRLIVSLLLLSIPGYSQLLVNSYRGTFGNGTVSAPTFASGGNYQTSREFFIYKPRGYDQASAASLPLMIFFPGYGARNTWANISTEGEGLYYYLNNGSWNDLTHGHIVVVCQYTAGDVDPNTGHFDDILTKLTTDGVKYDPNRISVTGLSGGAIGTYEILKVKYAQIASVIPVSGPSLTSGWGNWYGIGFWQHHGTSDGTFVRTIGSSLYWANGDFSAWREETPAPRGTYYYNEGHTSNVWNNGVYNPTATYNFFQFASKFNKNATNQATQFTDNAESTNDIVDYREAKQQVDALGAGAPKTALLARLATLLTTINKTNGVRYYVSPQTTGLGALNTGYNVWDAFATGNGITNIVNVSNGSSTIDLTMTQECAASSRDGLASSNNAGRQKSFGFDDYKINLQGFVVNNAVNNGVVTIGGVPTGKLVDIFIYHHHLAANDDGSAFSVNNRLQVVCNSVTKSQYSAYNNYSSISFTNVPETSGNITMAFDALDSRDCLVTGIELLVHD